MRGPGLQCDEAAASSCHATFTAYFPALSPSCTSSPDCCERESGLRFDKVPDRRAQITFHLAPAHCRALEPPSETRYQTCGERGSAIHSVKSAHSGETSLVTLTLIVKNGQVTIILLPSSSSSSSSLSLSCSIITPGLSEQQSHHHPRRDLLHCVLHCAPGNKYMALIALKVCQPHRGCVPINPLICQRAGWSNRSSN